VSLDTTPQVAKPSRIEHYRAVLVQFDLQKHSEWVKESQALETVLAKTELALAIARLMEEQSLIELTWAGDGGLYYARADEPGILAKTIRAATAAVRYFYEWRDKALDRQALEIRASVHVTRRDLYETTVVQDGRERKYVTSVDLNLFMKHERELGIPGCIAVTREAIKEYMTGSDEEWPTLLRNDAYERSVLPAWTKPIFSAARYVVVRPRINLASTEAFLLWLSTEAASTGRDLSYAGDIEPRDKIVSQLDRALVLQGFPLLAKTKYVLKHLPAVHSDWDVQVRNDLKKCASEVVSKLNRKDRVDSVRANPFRVRLPLPGAPIAEIEHFDGPFSETRAANQLLEQRDRSSSRTIFGMTISEGAELNHRSFPSILAVAAVVTTADHYLILGKRTKRGAASNPSSWSCTFERGMAAGETVEECARRGLSEELLGNFSLADAAVYEFAGAFLEDDVMNVNVLTFIELPYTLEQVVKQWRQIGANARLDLVAALNMRDNPTKFFVDCLNQATAEPLGLYAKDGLKRVLGFARSPAQPVFDRREEFKWEGTSLLRLAAAVWRQDAERS
jgi:hypothetical protein